MAILDQLSQKGIRLNPQQRQAALAAQGNALVLAVPGSGKTTVFVARLARMTADLQIPAGRLLNVTFSKAAARDMARRFQDLFPGVAAPAFCTLHSLCYRIVRQFAQVYRRTQPQLAEDPLPLVLRAYRSVQPAGYLEQEGLEDLSSRISLCKNLMMDAQQRGQIQMELCSFPAVFDAYETIKKESRLMDFDDLCVYAHDILLKCPDILSSFQARFPYVSVDEAQDTSLVQHRIIKRLAQKSGNLFMVGDEDQSIYAFRGAYPKELLDFETIYPGCVVLRMEENYRQTPQLVQRANLFIAQNTARYPKNMRSSRPGGAPVEAVEYRPGDDKTAMALEKLLSLPAGQTAAVLYRNNDSGLPLADALDRAGIPFTIKDRKSAFFSNAMVRDLIAFFKLSLNSADIDSFSRIYAKTSAYLCRAEFDFVVDSWRTGDDVFDVLALRPGTDRKKLAALQQGIASLCTLTPYRALCRLEDDILSRNYFKSPACVQRIQVLKSLARAHETLESFLTRFQQLPGRLEQHQKPEKRILSTIHASKGLEYDTVMMIDLIEGVFPSKDSLDALADGQRAAYEEEVRLFYVGATRARDALYLLYPARQHEQRASRFVSHLLAGPPSLPAFRAGKESPATSLAQLEYGARVRHKDFGTGVIIHLDSDTIGIRFEDGIKNLSAGVCLSRGLLALLNV